MMTKTTITNLFVMAFVVLLSSCGTSSSPSDIAMQRARQACTEVGLPAESSEVGECATRMQAALFASPP